MLIMSFLLLFFVDRIGACFSSGAAVSAPPPPMALKPTVVRPTVPSFKPMLPHARPAFNSPLPIPFRKPQTIQSQSLKAERARAAAEDEEEPKAGPSTMTVPQIERAPPFVPPTAMKSSIPTGEKRRAQALYVTLAFLGSGVVWQQPLDRVCSLFHISGLIQNGKELLS